MGAIRDKLNSIAKNERLFSLNELYDKEESMSWNEFFSELAKKVEAMNDEEFALYIFQGDIKSAEKLLKETESFRKVRNGITQDYEKLSHSNIEEN